MCNTLNLGPFYFFLISVYVRMFDTFSSALDVRYADCYIHLTGDISIMYFS